MKSAPPTYKCDGSACGGLAINCYRFRAPYTQGVLYRNKKHINSDGTCDDFVFIGGAKPIAPLSDVQKHQMRSAEPVLGQGKQQGPRKLNAKLVRR